MLDRLDESLAALDSAERRMAERATARERARARRERRRRWLGDGTRVPLLALAGAAATVALLERSGGDLGDWSPGAALAVLAALFAVPAAAVGLLARRRGAPAAVALAAMTLGAQLALTFGLAGAVLGVGPPSG